MPLILFLIFKAVTSPDKLLSSLQRKYVTFEYCLIFTSPYCMFKFQFSFFLFLVEKGFSFILPKVNAQLVSYKPITYIGVVLSESRSVALDLYVEMINMYHLRKEIDHNLQFVTYRFYTTEITKDQECILVKLRIIDWQG